MRREHAERERERNSPPPGGATAAHEEFIMALRTYRFVVIGSVLSSFLVGLHVPALHDMLEHSATPRWEVLIATLLLATSTVGGAWILLRTPAPLRQRAGQ
jgi:hypothetical protein